MMGSIVENKDQLRTSASRFASDAAMDNLRSILPYGLSSRAPAKKSALLIPVAMDPTHQNVVGHFDETRPTGDDGETLLYNEFDQLIYMKNGKILLGKASKSAAENLVLGQVFKTMMDTLLTAIAAHTHIGNLGYDTSPPKNAADFNDIKASPIDDNKILSDIVFTEKGS